MGGPLVSNIMQILLPRLANNVQLNLKKIQSSAPFYCFTKDTDNHDDHENHNLISSIVLATETIELI